MVAFSIRMKLVVASLSRISMLGAPVVRSVTLKMKPLASRVQPLAKPRSSEVPEVSKVAVELPVPETV